MATLSPARIPITLTAAGERALRGGHPWIFDQAIQRRKGEGKAGDLAIIFSHKKNKFIGVGLYDPDSPIRIRILHQGSPVQIDTDFFAAKIRTAYALRAALRNTDTNGYRLLHGENDGLPGLVVDVYAEVAVLKLYSPAWLPWLATLLPLIQATTQTESLVLRLARKTATAAAALAARYQPGHPWEDGAVLVGSLTDPVIVFREHGLRFAANVIAGHKTGFFLDHRENRRQVGLLAKGKKVLDIFSYAGGFSVHALAGGATHVTSLDISAPALRQAEANARLNELPADRHETIADDAFLALARLQEQGRSFDLVIVDPPSFAKSESEIPRALTAYRKINQLAIPLVAPGGCLLAASCSARVKREDFFQTIEGTLRASGRVFECLQKTDHDVDHPIGFPEGAYLKSGYYRL